jgi:protein phosphatase
VVFAVALAGLLGAAVGAIGIYARSGWFVGLQDDSVAVFRGRPSGILWFDPTLAERADLHLLDLADVDRSMVIDAIEVDSLEEARRVVGQLAQRAR